MTNDALKLAEEILKHEHETTWDDISATQFRDLVFRNVFKVCKALLAAHAKLALATEALEFYAHLHHATMLGKDFKEHFNAPTKDEDIKDREIYVVFGPEHTARAALKAIKDVAE